jgi:hypothetical protein
MSGPGPVRLAGWGARADGAAVTWTIAEGRRGRRWREVVTDDAGVQHSLLLETDVERRFSHLELASAAGLWTFHPEGDGTLHGNHVDPRGRAVRHTVGWPFGPDDLLVVEGSPLSAAANAWRLAAELNGTDVFVRSGVRLDPSGDSDRDVTIRVERITGTRWRIGAADPIEITSHGTPILDGGATAPIELE